MITLEKNDAQRRIDEALHPLRSERNLCEMRKQELEKEIANVNRDIWLIDRVLRAAQPTSNRKKKSSTRENQDGSLVSSTTLEIMLKHLRSHSYPNGFTRADLIRDVRGMSKYSVERALRQARVDGHVRLAGTRPQPKGKQGHAHKLFKVVTDGTTA